MFGLVSRGGLSAAEVARLERMERKLDLILDHVGLVFANPPGVGLSEEVQRLAESGQKIAAIKIYRETTGAGLLEAKNAVEAYLASQG